MSKKFKVVLTEDAEQDLGSIYDHFAGEVGYEQAGIIEDRLMESILSLSSLPARGKVPEEMLYLGISIFREIQTQPWRVFYAIEKDLVVVIAVLDGRRNIAELLAERLIR